jgi:hypothetical protein
MQQGTIILSGFMSEQLEGDLKRNELVSEGKMTRREAEEEAEEWEKVSISICRRVGLARWPAGS